MIYTSLLPSCLFVQSFLIEKLKVKWTLVVCIFSYSTYIAAQFYPEFYTLLPTAFILGMGAAPMWSAKCTYLTQVAHRFAGLDGSDPGPVVVKFFGIFFFFFQCNSIIGSLISTIGTLVLQFWLFKFSSCQCCLLAVVNCLLMRYPIVGLPSVQLNSWWIIIRPPRIRTLKRTSPGFT